MSSSIVTHFTILRIILAALFKFPFSCPTVAFHLRQWYMWVSLKSMLNVVPKSKNGGRGEAWSVCKSILGLCRQLPACVRVF